MQANQTTHNVIAEWLLRLDRRVYALMVGLLMGMLAGVLALMVVTLDAVIAFGLVIGVIVGLFILTDVHYALYAIIGLMLILPFGTLPFDIGFTPTLLDVAIGVFLLVYLLQWMKGYRRTLSLTPVHGLLAVYVLWLLLAFALGLRHAPPTLNTLRQFVETLLSLSLVFIVVDLLRDTVILRRLVVVILLAVAVQAVMAIGLYALPDDLAETILNRLGRVGYPVGGVIRYIESNPALPERAIGTWIDPNTLGGVLAISAVVIAPQIFARRPVLRYRWLTVLVLLLVALALFLSYSRASMLAFVIGLGVIAVMRYRRFVPWLAVGGLLLLLLPQTQAYVERFIDAFTGADLATQMRIGEYTDSLRLIGRYPVFGVGFTGTPDIDLYTDVASMYLIMANQIGLVGLVIFLVFVGAVLLYGITAWRFAARDDELDALHLGYHAALITAMANAVADLYFFRLEYQGAITLFWLTVALAIASSRLVLERRAKRESSVVKQTDID